MSTYGDTTYGIMISTDVTGTSPDETPYGDILYLLSPEFGGTESFTSMITDLAGGLSFGMRDGKRNISITVQDCYVVGYSALNNTEGFNAIHNILKQWHIGGILQHKII